MEGGCCSWFRFGWAAAVAVGSISVVAVCCGFRFGFGRGCCCAFGCGIGGGLGVHGRLSAHRFCPAPTRARSTGATHSPAWPSSPPRCSSSSRRGQRPLRRPPSGAPSEAGRARLEPEVAPLLPTVLVRWRKSRPSPSGARARSSLGTCVTGDVSCLLCICK